MSSIIFLFTIFGTMQTQPARKPNTANQKQRTVQGTVNRQSPTPVKLARVPSAEARITPKQPDKRKVQPAPNRTVRTDPYPAMGIYQIHLKEFVRIRVYDENGFLRPQAVSEFNRINRCIRNGVVLEMDYRLLVEMYEAWLAFGMPAVTLFSGCRQAPHASGTSRHNFGKAVDYNFDGVARRDLVAYFLERRNKVPYGMGIGYYPNSYHIHMDVRQRHAFWVDLNGAGKPGSKMVADSYTWFANESRNRNRPQVLKEKQPDPSTVTMQNTAAPENAEE